MQVDYIIVGFGLAGLAFAEVLEQNNKSYIVFNDKSQQSSLVAAGGYNPVILKRFSPVWDAINQLEIAMPFYEQLESKLGKTYDYKIDVYRILTSVEEQNNWASASDKPFFKGFMQTQILQNFNENIEAPFGCGVLKNVGRIDTEQLLTDYQGNLSKQEKIKHETFDYDAVEFSENSIVYQGIKATKIVFCEGFGLKKNSFFNHLPLNGTKGEVLLIKAPELKIDVMLKSSVFVMPLGNDLYKVGATFNWTDKTSNPTQEGKKELTQKLDEIINTPYEIINQFAGIRPTVKDRRPLLGSHQKYNQLAVLNGLGTRGVMLAPKMAQLLYNSLEKGENLPDEVAIKRFQL